MTDFHNVISNVADSIVIVDQEGILRFANPSAEALFGRNLKELLGKQFGFPCVTDQTTEIEVISKSGELHTAEMRMTETVWEGKRAYLASIRDFTELKRLEQELREQAHFLGERVKELNCLYSISKLIERPGVSFEEVARDIWPSYRPGGNIRGSPVLELS
jgi:transcriptional regulator with PAS, ATPase and Fis domain